MNNSNFSGRTSRTLGEAFGAHCNEAISADQHAPMQRSEHVFCWVVGSIGLLAVALMVAGVIA